MIAWATCGALLIFNLSLDLLGVDNLIINPLTKQLNRMIVLKKFSTKKNNKFYVYYEQLKYFQSVEILTIFMDLKAWKTASFTVD